MRRIIVITEGETSGHGFDIGDIVYKICETSNFFVRAEDNRGQYLDPCDYKIREEPDEFIVATIDGKRYKCFPMKDGE